MKTGLALSVIAILAAAEACKQSESSNGTDATNPNTAATSPDGDQADAPAPVAGAYLTCLVAKPKPGDDYLNAGCQLRHPTKVKVDCKKLGSHLWSYVPPKGATVDPKTKPNVEVFDLCADPKKNYYFQVGMRMKIAKAPAKGMALASQRDADANFFLNLKPAIVFNPKPKGSGLSLTNDTTDGRPGAIVSAGTLKQETIEVVAALKNPLSPKGMPKGIVDTASLTSVFDPATQVAKPDDSTVLTPTPSGSVLEVLPADQQNTVMQAEASATASDTTTTDVPPIGAPDTTVPYFQDIDTPATVVDPVACTTQQPQLKDRYDQRAITEDEYARDCKAVCGDAEPLCAVAAPVTTAP